jgi:hypothetical protein
LLNGGGFRKLDLCFRLGQLVPVGTLKDLVILATCARSFFKYVVKRLLDLNCLGCFLQFSNFTALDQVLNSTEK